MQKRKKRKKKKSLSSWFLGRFIEKQQQHKKKKPLSTNAKHLKLMFPKWLNLSLHNSEAS